MAATTFDETKEEKKNKPQAEREEKGGHGSPKGGLWASLRQTQGYDAQRALLSPRAFGDGTTEEKGFRSSGGVSLGSISPTEIEFLLAWNSNADLTKVLAFSTAGITAFGIQLLAEMVKDGREYLKGYPNFTEEQWRWIKESGHPFAIGNYWEENSRGKPLVFTNVYGHGTLGIINMAVADKLFPNSPIMALVAASIMYTNFELFGEGFVKAKYEPNDFFISNVIPMIGSQAFADLFHLQQKVPMSVVASAQALVYALGSGKKMSKDDWLKLAGYPVLAKLVESLSILRGRSQVLDETLAHLATTFGISERLGPYTGLGYSQQFGDVRATEALVFGPGGQRASVRVEGERWKAEVFGERSYRETGATYQVGADFSMALGGPKKDEVAQAQRFGKERVSGYLDALSERTTRKDLKERLKGLKKELLAAVERCRSREEVISLVSEVEGVVRGLKGEEGGDASSFEGAIAYLREIASRIR